MMLAPHQTMDGTTIFKVALVVFYAACAVGPSVGRRTGCSRNGAAGAGSAPRIVIAGAVRRDRVRLDDDSSSRQLRCCRLAWRTVWSLCSVWLQARDELRTPPACSAAADFRIPRSALHLSDGSRDLCMVCAFAACERVAACCVRSVCTIVLRACM